MTEELHTIRVLAANGSMTQVQITTTFEGRECKLMFSLADKSFVRSASDFFEAMQSVRVQLETVGCRLVCYGASKNVWPSGMSRSMGGGRMAHRLALGRKPTKADLVDIFDSEPDLIPATVEEQSSFHEEWLKSVGCDVKHPQSSLIARIKESWFMRLLLILLACLAAYHFGNLK